MTPGFPITPLDHQRCTATVRSTGERCKKAHLVGLNVCRSHGGQLPNNKKVSVQAKLLSKAVARYGNNAVDEAHQGANIISGIAWEIRRTAGNILAVEEKLAKLRDDQIVVEHATTTRVSLDDQLRELIGEDLPYRRSGESYTMTKNESRLNLWAGLYMQERQAYREILKLAAAVGFEKKRIELIQAQVGDLNAVITNTLRALGHDPEDPDVRAVVRQSILAVMPMPAEQ